MLNRCLPLPQMLAMFPLVMFLHHLLPWSLLWLGTPYSHFETLLVIFLSGSHQSGFLAGLFFFPIPSSLLLISSSAELCAQSVPLTMFPAVELRQLEKTVNESFPQWA